MPNRDFLHPRSRYRGVVKPENLVFNDNLQQFAQQVSYISNLETAGKLAPQEAFGKIEDLWGQLARSKHQLGIGKSRPDDRSS